MIEKFLSISKSEMLPKQNQLNPISQNQTLMMWKLLGGGNNMNFSLEEQVVGTWIDGKPLYQKTIIINDMSGASKWAKIKFDTECDCIDFAFSISAIMQCNTENGYIYESFGYDTMIEFSDSKGVFHTRSNDFTPNYGYEKLYVTFCYTKTID